MGWYGEYGSLKEIKARLLLRRCKIDKTTVYPSVVLQQPLKACFRGHMVRNPTLWSVWSTTRLLVRGLSLDELEHIVEDWERYDDLGNRGLQVPPSSVLSSTEDFDRFIHCDMFERWSDGWHYKPLDESCGPIVHDCPLSYLEAAPELNPTWRQAVREYHRYKSTLRRARRRRQLGLDPEPAHEPAATVTTIMLPDLGDPRFRRVEMCRE